MTYTRNTWVNNAPPAINAANLNNIEVALVDLDARAALVGNFTDSAYGGVAGGVTDNTAAFTAAAGDIVFFPPGTYLLSNSSFITLAAGTRWFAAPGTVTVNIAGTASEAFRITGTDVILEGLNFVRTADNATVVFSVRADRFTVRNCTLNGARDSFSNYCQGFQVGQVATNTLRVYDSKFTKMSYPLFMDSADTSTVTDIVFDGCYFTNNYSSDLEFNSPNGTISDVTVSSCVFKDNQHTTSGAGWGVGFAHVLRGTIRDCYFTNSDNEAIHVEDQSDSIDIINNKMINCGKSRGSYVQVISNTREIHIANNLIDARSNTNASAIYCINVLQGGAGPTPGGRTAVAPRNVVISGNTVYGGTSDATHGIYVEAVLEATITGNVLIGTGSVAAGVYSGTLRQAIYISDGRGINVTGNTIRGWLYGFPPIATGTRPFGQGGVVTGNTIRDCSIGIAALDIGSVVISGNMIYNCVKPLIAGAGSSTGPLPSVIIGNHAYGCAQKMVIADSTVVSVPVGAATVTTGAGKTLTVSNLHRYLPSGTALTFSGTGVMTLTSSANTQATTITGTVTVASITATETATVSLAYSPVGANSHRLLANNAEDVAGGLGYTQDIDGY